VRVSPTTLNMYFECPRMAYYKIMGFKEIAPYYKESLERGTITHKIIEEFYKGDVDGYTLTEIKLRLSQIYHTISSIHSEQIENSLLNFAKFEVWRKERMYRFVASEKRVTKEYKGVTIVGVIDLLLKAGDKYVIVDWKTGYNGYVTEDILRQLSIYSWMVNADKAYVVFLDWGNWEEVEPFDVTTEIETIINDKEFKRTYSKCDTCGYQIICLGDRIVLHI